jgi:hypothetical protein
LKMANRCRDIPVGCTGGIYSYRIMRYSSDPQENARHANFASMCCRFLGNCASIAIRKLPVTGLFGIQSVW